MRIALIGIACLALFPAVSSGQTPRGVPAPGAANAMSPPRGPYTPQVDGYVTLPLADGPPATAPADLPAYGCPRATGALNPLDAVHPAPVDPWWYQPCYWYGPIWESSTELGINGAEGNNQAFSFQVGSEFKRKCKTHELLIDLVYTKTTADSDTTQHNAITKLRFDRFFDCSPWSLYVLSNGIYDELKPFDFRVSVTTGLGYSFIKNARATLTTRVGSGVSHEIGSPDDRYVPEADFGLDFEYKLSKRQKFYGTVDLYPDWKDFQDYRIISDVGWEFLLDKATNLSLKLSIIDRYDSTPNGAKHNDVNYSLLLLWKL